MFVLLEVLGKDTATIREQSQVGKRQEQGEDRQQSCKDRPAKVGGLMRQGMREIKCARGQGGLGAPQLDG